MNERKHELVYVLVRRTPTDNTTVACGVYHDKDKEEAYKTAEFFNELPENRFIFEVQVTALFE